MLNFCRSVYKPMSENIFKEYHKFFSLQEQFEETKGVARCRKSIVVVIKIFKYK